jgi:hypothetical protein
MGRICEEKRERSFVSWQVFGSKAALECSREIPPFGTVLKI